MRATEFVGPFRVVVDVTIPGQSEVVEVGDLHKALDLRASKVRALRRMGWVLWEGGPYTLWSGLNSVVVRIVDANGRVY